MDIPKRKLGKTGIDVTILGLGGEVVLRTFGYDKEAYTLINRALAHLQETLKNMKTDHIDLWQVHDVLFL